MIPSIRDVPLLSRKQVFTYVSNERLRTWQIIAVDVAIVSGLVMLALLVYGAWERLRR